MGGRMTPAGRITVALWVLVIGAAVVFPIVALFMGCSS